MQALKKVMDYLAEMSFRLDLEKDASPFKKKAYNRALESLTAAGTLDSYADLAGVGPSIRADIEEIIKTGTCKKLVEIRRSGPPASVMELLKIRNVGPKKAMQLYESGIDSILTTVNAPMELHTALEQAEELYLNAARRLFRMLKAGSQMQETK
jgi:DNA polymerase/3'-5' exonuclease PolX